jgi:hypothetical protein
MLNEPSNNSIRSMPKPNWRMNNGCF